MTCFLTKNLHFCRFLVFLQCNNKGVKILVLTETDACCGPMAAAFLRDYSPALEVESAGNHPLESIDSMVVTVMKECLIDLTGYRPKNVIDFDLSAFHVVYECPDVPAPTTMEEFRALRDRIKNEAYLFFRNTLTTLNSPQH